MPTEKTLAPHLRGVDPEYHTPDENGFVGVDPIYSNAANETDEPHKAPGDDLDELKEAGVNNQFELADAEAAKSGSDASDAVDESNNVDDEVKKPSAPSASKVTKQTPPKAGA